MIRRVFGRVVGQSEKGVFMSIEQTQLQTVRAKLAQAELDVIAARQQLATAAFEAAISDDQGKAEGAQLRLDQATSHRDRLLIALTVAEAAEQERLARRGTKEDKARRRATAAHLASLTGHVAKLADLSQQMQVVYDAAVRSAEATYKTLPSTAPQWSLEQLSSDFLRDLIDVERYRLGQAAFVPLTDPSRRPPMRLPEVQDRATGHIPTLTENIAAAVGRLRAAFVRTEIPKPSPVAVGSPTPAAVDGASPYLDSGAPPSPGAAGIVGSPAAPGEGPPLVPAPFIPGGRITGVAVEANGALTSKFAGGSAEPVGEREPDLATGVAAGPEEASQRPDLGGGLTLAPVPYDPAEDPSAFPYLPR